LLPDDNFRHRAYKPACVRSKPLRQKAARTKIRKALPRDGLVTLYRPRKGRHGKPSGKRATLAITQISHQEKNMASKNQS